jgi:hypothetical protein
LTGNQTGLSFESNSYANFINALRSPSTKKGYENSFRRYLNYLKLDSPDDLLIHADNPKYIESQIRDYILSLRSNGVAYASIQFLIAPIFTFYQLNDVILNRKKVSRYIGEYKRVVKDEAYTTEQIAQMLQNADIRMRMMLLILSSTGARIGSLPGLVLGNLTKMSDYGLYKIVFYEGSSSEFYNFTTRECASTGIDNYLFYRQRCGEKISFNVSTGRWEPYDSPLIRLQFDVNDVLQVRNPQPMTLSAIRVTLSAHLVKAGIRQIEHPTDPNSLNRVRKSIPFTNGFRKRAISIFIQAGLNHEVREMLSDHDTHLDAHYYRPTEEQVLSEYLKAESYLMIDQSAKLAKQVQTLKIEKSKMELLEQRVAELSEVFQKFTT